MWAVFAILSAVFAALTSILAKVGIEGVNSNLATAIRTVVVLVMAWGMVFLTNAQSGITEIGKKAGCFLFCRGLPQARHGSVITGHYRWGKRQRWCRLIR